MYCMTYDLFQPSVEKSISMSVNISNFTLDFLKETCHANPGADK